jgi:hypothetical protein
MTVFMSSTSSFLHARGSTMQALPQGETVTPAIRPAFLIVLSLAATPALPAQVCFRGRPAPTCRAFTVLEFTGALRMNGKSAQTDNSSAFFYWTAGLLVNRGERSALGAGFKVTADSDGHRYGPVFRYRRWLGPRTSLDFAPGIFLGGEDNFTTLRFPSATADIALTTGDLVGVAVGMDVLRARGGDTQWQVHAGLRLGSWLAPLGTIGLGLLVAATW